MTFAPEYVISHSGVRNGTFQNIGAINDALSIQTTQQVKSKANTFELKLANPLRSDGRYKYQDIFLPDDEIGIKLGQGFVSGNVPQGVQQEMLGVVKSFDYDISENGNFLTVKGDDLSTKTLDFIVLNQFSSGTRTASAIVTEVMGDLNQVLPINQKLTLQITTTSGLVEADIRSDNRRARDVLDEVSIDEHTHAGNFTYYIQTSGSARVFYWKPKSTTVDRQVNAEGECYSFRPSKSVYNIKNFLYINCGDDGSGNNIWTYAANFQSIAEVGWKADVYPQVNIAEELKSQGYGGTTLLTKAREKGRQQGLDKLNKLSHPSWKADAEFPGTNSYNLDNFIYVTSSGLGGEWTQINTEVNMSTGAPYNGFKLRIDSIKKEFSTKGYFATLGLLENLELT